MFRQKKRVTSGEALVGHAKVLYADEISTGLDSNTTYTIVKSLRNICHVMNVSAALG
jgi:ABC-type glutathione transport system ATPase component